MYLIVWNYMDRQEHLQGSKINVEKEKRRKLMPSSLK